MSVSGYVHLQDIGDQHFSNSSFAGTRGQSRRLEGLSLNVHGIHGVDIEYMAHIQDRGDTHWHRNGEFCGSRGQSKRVEGVAIRLSGPNAGLYDVTYTAHIEGLGDQAARNGEFVGSRGQSRRLEGFQVLIQPRPYPVMTQSYVTQPPIISQPMMPMPPPVMQSSVVNVPMSVPTVSGYVHLQDIGDQYFSNSNFAGTRGQSRRLEGLSLTISGAAGLDIEYMAHIQDRGDTHWHRNGEFCGSRGQSKRVEGVAVRLSGPNAGLYDVSYTAHIEGIGDQTGRNGDFVGTRGQHKRLEGIQVNIQPRYGVSMPPSGYYQTTTTQVVSPYPGAPNPAGGYPGYQQQQQYQQPPPGYY